MSDLVGIFLVTTVYSLRGEVDDKKLQSDLNESLLE